VNYPLLVGTISTFFTAVVLGAYNTITGQRQRKVTDALAISQQELQEQTTERDYQSRIIIEQADYIERLEKRSEKLETIVGQLRDEVSEVRDAHATCEDIKRELRADLDALKRGMGLTDG
jgi:chromosome segregation ATPase